MLNILEVIVNFCTYFIIAILGGALASFAVCAGERIAHEKNWINDRSVCDSCGHVLGVLDMVPVFSYIFLRGKCRHCGAKIPPTSFITEIGMAGLSILCFSRFGVSVKTLQILLLAVVLLSLSVVDILNYEIPDGFIVSGIVLWVITTLFNFSVNTLIDSIAGALVISGGMLVISLVFDRILKKDSLGGGDIKLFFMTGLFLGLKLGLLNVIFSCLIGLVFVFIMKKDRIPFGPSISIATIITLLYGNVFLAWYAGFLIG